MSMNASSHYGDEDGDNWIPLKEEPSEQTAKEAANSVLNAEPRMGGTSRAVATTTPRRNRNDDAPADLRMLQRKLETKSRLKQGLVDHPLDQAWQRFIVHLGGELWQLDLSIRLGVVMIVFGTIFQSIVMATFFPWYDPRIIILTIIFGVSCFYLVPATMNNFDDPLQAAASLIPVHRLTATQIRVVFLTCCLIPTWLEMRTLGFLSQVLVQAGWGYNLFVTAVVCAVLLYRRKKQPFLSPRLHFYSCIYVLYGGALWISLLHFRIADIPKTAGPFLLSSGTLLFSQADQRQYTRALRHALRLTLRDTLATLSDNVQQDEMLQLAMLRWIVDYWSTRPSDQDTAPPTTRQQQSSATNNSRASSTTAVPAPVQSGSLVIQDTVTTSEAPSATPSPPTPNVSRPRRSSSNRRRLANGEEIQWGDLLSMLDMTANQMEEEVHYDPLTDENDSVKNLRQMLTSMDVDEHAKPAVDAYKQLIQDFPPSRETALALSVAKRCPASLLLLWRYLMASALALPSTVTLVPFILIEGHRVLRWAEVCHRSVATEEEEEVNLPLSVQRVISIPKTVDSMSLLLSSDNFSPLRPPTLLQVWFNVQSSVQALEAGLTAARCAQTTVAAAEFADHLMSLAHLGMEVSQKGWVHGLGILAQELIHLQVAQGEGRYTSAAKGALRNSQTMARNVQVLVEEDAPIIGFLQGIVGRGWLWGHEEQQGPPIPESTVVITELKEGEEEEEVGDLKPEASAPVTNRATSTPVETVSSKEALEVTKIVANAHRRGLINDVDSTSFTEMLKDEADGNVVESVRASLTLLMEEEEERNIEQRAQIGKVSEAVELTADNYERGLINEAEKNSFMEVLAANPASNAVESVKKSLTRVLEEEEARQQAERCRAEDNANEVKKLIVTAYVRGVIGETQKCLFESIMAGKPDKKAVESIKASLEGFLRSKEAEPTANAVVPPAIFPTASWEVASQPDAHETESGSLADIDKVTEDNAPDKSSSDVCLPKIIPAIYASSSWEETAQNADEYIGASSWEATVSEEIEPRYQNQLGQELNRRLQLEPTADVASVPANEQAQHRTDDKSGDDWGKWVGGGLAVLGAVVSTVALHNAQQQDGDDQQRRKRRNESTGHIVVLSTEVEDDGWVAVSGSQE
jgi:hypothetical protein